MSSNLTHGYTTLNPSKKECEPCACPTCGGLECLCRPRFFAGQLLTDETFNNLDHYIIEKNKLHNRYLHGWGVVCGLEVVCGPCNQVTVRPGYALSPCGDDIIVCKPTSVDICELINKCKSKVPEWECEPFPAGGNQDCPDPEEWILTIRYDEKGSRGVTALRASSGATCCSSCSCGGSSSCGCGCKGSNGNGNGSSRQASTVGTSVTTGKYSYRPAQATVAVQCEPTLTCEGYVFDVAKRPPAEDKASAGAMVDRITKCFKDLVDRQPKPPGPNATIPELKDYCCRLKESLRRELIDHPVYNCGLGQVLAKFSCPTGQFNSPDDYRKAMDAEIEKQLSIIGAEYVRYCICAAFLPPCPEIVCDPRVPIASVTIRREADGSCTIVRVCNLGVRKFVTTFLSLGYWLSFLTPVLRLIRRVLELLCCKEFSFQLSNRGLSNTGVAGTPNVTAANISSGVTNVRGRRGPITNKRGFSAFASRVWENRGTPIDAQTLFLGGIGARDENGDPYLAQTEIANPFFTVMVNNLAGPLLAKLPDNALDVAKNSGRMVATGSLAQSFAASGQDREINELKSKLADLQNTVDDQSKTIEKLRKTVEKRK